MENQTTYRIRTELGNKTPINIPISLMQEYNSFEILSLKLNMDDTYRSYTSNEGIVLGRVSTANNGLGIPNVRVSIFVPKGNYSQTDEEEVLYPFSSPTDTDSDKIRYNLLPSESDVACYQVVGTLPTKRKILDNETVCEVFEKYYKYTTVTNEAGDFMLSNIPVGKQRIHIDADLSDIGPFLSQRPYDMIENLGIDKNKFESTRQFKTSTDLDSLAQIISQNKSVYVYPYWGDTTENSSNIKITRTDLSLNYEFKTGAIFMGSIITDKQGNSIRQNCTPVEKNGKMSEMVTGPGTIEMIRKTKDDKIEQYRIKGDKLINDNGVWCYMVPMNLDYVRTDEYGNIIPTDDPNKGVPTRARVRFRISLTEMESDEDSHKRCSYLVPNNPQIDDKNFLETNSADYAFGTETCDESFVDLFWNKVYTVKNYIPQLQKNTISTNRKHTGIKMVNHFGDNNPFPYNNISIRLTFVYRLICVISSVLIEFIASVNNVISMFGYLFCKIVNVKVFGVKIFKSILGWIMDLLPNCIALSSEFCDDGINKIKSYPGCGTHGLDCIWKEKTKPNCAKEQKKIADKGGEAAVCTNDATEVYNCIENQLAQENEVVSFNFANDWINGCLYMPLWYRLIRPKKTFLFGLFRRKAKDKWCAGDDDSNGNSLEITYFCSHKNTKKVNANDYKGEKIEYNITKSKDNCGGSCHKAANTVGLEHGLILNRETLTGGKVWYYKAVEAVAPKDKYAVEYKNLESQPMVSKTLYATDIVLLGSMNDCDLNGIPKFYNYLKASTYNMPTDVLFTDTEISYTMDENGKVVNQESQKISVASGCDWGNKNEYDENDGGLFYSIGCSGNSIKVDTPSCINLRRICELGVGQDEIQYIDNITKPINSENDELDYGNTDYYLRPDGFISYDDIIDFNYRSMFATMNGNKLRTKINTDSGIYEYDLRHLYIDNFDGSLEELMKEEQLSRDSKVNYRYNYKLESTNLDYLTFRMGDKPYYYDGKSIENNANDTESEEEAYYSPSKFSMPKYQNSFYFYFGLKEGKTAIDLFNEQYNAHCSTQLSESESILYNAIPNGWCSERSGQQYTAAYDGSLSMRLKDITLPCTIIFNSKDNAAVTYTVRTEKDKDDTNVTDEKICFYGGDNPPSDIKDYVRYELIYEDSSSEDEEGEDDDNPNCQMLKNGEYTAYVTDGDGNQHIMNINIKKQYLEFDDVEENFIQSNEVLLSYYEGYKEVALSPIENSIEATIDENGIPSISRTDKEKDNLKETDTIKEVKLNGTICIYNIYDKKAPLEDFIIEVEPYDKDSNGNYTDEDFWQDKDSKDKTWYKPKMINVFDQNEGYICYDYAIDENGVIEIDGESEYFVYRKAELKDETTKKVTKSVDCYIIKCPKGETNYRVRVTQVCKDNEDDEIYYITNNYIERKITVSQPTPYKLFINGVDYDIIKNFKTGYNLREKKGDQYNTLTGPNPFKDFGSDDNDSKFGDIKGWLNIADINNEYYDWEVDKETYGTNDIVFTTDGVTKVADGKTSVDITKLVQIKEGKKPNEDDESYTESLYEEWYNGWTYGYKDGTEWIRTLDDTGKGEKLNDDIKQDIELCNNAWDLGGPCGYKYIEKYAKYLENRQAFVDKMKAAFWIQQENSEKTITYQVTTDATPYSIWTMYNEEIVSTNNEDYNETDSKPKDDSRKKWYYKGESTNYLEGIKIPTIAAYSSDSFGVEGDSKREKMTQTFSDKTCFAQDNIAADSKENGSVSIKPPYLVACVNGDGISKPLGMKEGQFFDDTTNSYGLKTYQFGNVNKNNGYLKKGDKEFFGFHLIDKIFTSDIVCWSYMNQIPYYLPWYDYDTEPNDDNKLGYVINMEGIVSGNINNGITASKQSDTFVDDFTETDIFDNECFLTTYDGDEEDDIPTRRCILQSNKELSNEEKNNLTYQNYKFTTKLKEGATKIEQYTTVPNREGELSFTDKDNNCTTTKILYGSMKVPILYNCVNNSDKFEYYNEGEPNDAIIGIEGPSNISIKCSNGDTENSITYYIFQVSQDGTDKEISGHRISSYPLNFISYNDGDDTSKKQGYYLDCKCNETQEEEEDWIWKGTKETASYFFNKNTTESVYIKNKNKWVKTDLVYPAKSNVTYEDSEGETHSTKTDGYGNTGVFTDIGHFPYFVVAVTQNGCRAVSPVYDFNTVFYIAGIIEKDGKYILRTALVFVLQSTTQSDERNKIDESELFGVSYTKYPNPDLWKDKIEYCKKPRNYYLTQFDYSVSYEFSESVTTEFEVEKSNEIFVSKIAVNNLSNVGCSAVDVDTFGKIIHYDKGYLKFTNTGGTIEIGEETTIEPRDSHYTESEKIEVKEKEYSCYFRSYTGDVDDEGNYEFKYQRVDFNKDGTYKIKSPTYNAKKNIDIFPKDNNSRVLYKYIEYQKDNITYYRTVTWSVVKSEYVSTNPRIPYFMKYHEEELTEEKYNDIKDMFKSEAKVRENGKYYVQDVTGLTHKCLLYRIINNDSGWDNYLTPPLDTNQEGDQTVINFVDLGLESGTQWMDCNIGGKKETDYGLYFQWGAKMGYTGDEAKTHSTWETAPTNGGNSNYSSKSFNKWKNSYLEDGVLTTSVDAAYIQTDGKAKMPTKEQCEELCNGTNVSLTTINSIKGWKFTSKKDETKYIFIPIAGHYNNENYYNTIIHVWTSTVNDNNGGNAYQMQGFNNSKNCEIVGTDCCTAMSIRGVKVNKK